MRFTVRSRLCPERGLGGGLMAAVGLGARAAEAVLARAGGRAARCVVACDNSPATIVNILHGSIHSCPAVQLRALLKELVAEGTFVRELETGGVAYHSPMLQPVLAELTTALEGALPAPRRRTAAWLSSTFGPESAEPDAAHCSAAYHVAAFSRRVLFTAAVAAVPAGAVLLEVGPHSLLRGPLRQGRPNLAYVAAMRRGEAAAETLPGAVAELWRMGVAVAWRAPPPTASEAELPRAVREALCAWDHSEEYPLGPRPAPAEAASFSMTFDLGHEAGAFLADHAVDGAILLPATAFLVTAWEALAARLGRPCGALPVVFEDVAILQAVPLKAGGAATLRVSLDARQRFQILSDGDLYGAAFRVLLRVRADGSAAVLRWDGCWVRLLDGLLQAGWPQAGSNRMRLPTRIRCLAIPAPDAAPDAGTEVVVEVDRHADSVACRMLPAAEQRHSHGRGSSGLLAEVAGVEMTVAPRRPPAAKTTAAALLQWQPYGVRVDPNPERLRYVREVSAYAAMRVAQALRERAATHAGGLDLHLKKVLAMAEAVPCPVPEGEQLQALLDAPDHCLARLARDLFATPSSSAAALEAATTAIVQHAEHGELYVKDPFCAVFPGGPLHALLDIVAENQAPGGFCALEVGAGTGGFTRQVLDRLDRNATTELVRYTATDVTASFGQALLGGLASPKLAFQVWDINEPAPSALREPVGLITASNAVHTCADLARSLRHLAAALAPGGFLLLAEATGPLACLLWGLDARCWRAEDTRDWGLWVSIERWRSLLAAAGLRVVVEHRCADETSALFLCRKLPTELPPPLLLAGPQAGASAADMDRWLAFYHTTIAAASAADMVATAAELDLLSNVFVGGVHGCFGSADLQLSELEERGASGCPAHGMHLDPAAYGQPQSLRWVANPPPAAADTLSCNVAFGALNFKDVMLAFGKLSRDALAHEGGAPGVGFEFSGTAAGGRRVMGVARRALATRVSTRPELAWDVPAAWSLADAASIPVAYCTAYCALVVRGRLCAGQRVLVHSGAGGVGLAAIAIALHRGCEVYATCGTEAKRRALLARFPGLSPACIGDSRSCAFEALVRRGTAGRGVHLVLNSLAGDKLQASVRCLAPYGRLLELGKYDVLGGGALPMQPLDRNIAFEGIDLDRLFFDGAASEQGWEVHALLEAGLASGEVQPLPVTEFPASRAADALRHLAAGTHVGKVLVAMGRQHGSLDMPGKPADGPNSPPSTIAQSGGAAPRAVANPAFRSDRSYLITGGLGGLGLPLAAWLAQRGARALVLTSRRGVRTGEQTRALTELRASGVQVHVCLEDVSLGAGARAAVAAADAMAPLAGIMHLAMLLDDAPLAAQTGAGWNAAAAPKAWAAQHLDAASRGLPCLEHFVMFSSIVAAYGQPGQANYGYANGVCEMVTLSRRREGLPALALAWGAVDDAGYVAEVLQGKLVGRIFCGRPPLAVDEALRVLGAALAAGEAAPPVVLCFAAEPSLYGSPREAAAVEKDLAALVLEVMGLAPGAAEPRHSLADMGIDSMQQVEVRALVQRALGCPFPLEKVAGLTVATIRAMAAASRKGGTSAMEQIIADKTGRHVRVTAVDCPSVPSLLLLPGSRIGDILAPYSHQVGLRAVVLPADQPAAEAPVQPMQIDGCLLPTGEAQLPPGAFAELPVFSQEAAAALAAAAAQMGPFTQQFWGAADGSFLPGGLPGQALLDMPAMLTAAGLTAGQIFAEGSPESIALINALAAGADPAAAAAVAAAAVAASGGVVGEASRKRGAPVAPGGSGAKRARPWGSRGIYLTEDPVYAAPGPRPLGEFGLAQELAHDVDHVGLVLAQRVAQAVLPGDEGDLTEYMKPVTVIDEKGQLWPFNAVRDGGRWYLRHGWQQFAQVFQLHARSVVGVSADPERHGFLTIQPLRAPDTATGPRPKVARRPVASDCLGAAGPYSVRFTVGAGGSGMSGRALKMPGRLGRAMFAGAEREFLGADAVRRDAVIVDPLGMEWPVMFALRRYHSKGQNSVTRLLHYWADVSRAWGFRDEDIVALECPDPAVQAFCVRLLNRIAERVGGAPAMPRPRPVLAPPHHASSAAQAAKNVPRTVELPFCLAILLRDKASDGRPLRLVAATAALLFPQQEVAFRESPSIQVPLAVADADDRIWPMTYVLKRSAGGHAARYIAGFGPWVRAWGVQDGDTLGLELHGGDPCCMRAQIINRATACLPDAAPPQQHIVPRWQRGGGRARVPGVGAVARAVAPPAQIRHIMGPLCVRMVYSLSNVSGRTLRLSQPLTTALFPGALTENVATKAATVKFTLADESGRAFTMTLVCKRYNTGLTRHVADWIEFATAVGLREGDVLSITREADTGGGGGPGEVVALQAALHTRALFCLPPTFAGPVGVRLMLGQSSARWQLRLPQASADALFPEQEAAIATVDTVDADVVASDQEGRDWTMKYQLKRAESRAGRTRSLTGWRPLSAALGLAAGDVLAIERVSDPHALPLLLTVRVLARGAPPAADVATLNAAADAVEALPLATHEAARPRRGRAAAGGTGSRGVASRVAVTLDPSEAANAMLGLRQPNVAGAES
ncbi:hypothetical protein WJX81_005723 [Elliptochloris bilobata]|uniref:Carrier domain-containing protein n=1 Tax=Elliptochloris bilobata TaxID=381761 RepID=A0AAW1QY82_9CHLO